MMKRTLILMDWWICENFCVTKSGLEIPCDPFQNFNDTPTELEEIILKFIWRHRRSWVDKVILSQKTMLKVSQQVTSNCVTKATLRKITEYWHKKRHVHWGLNRPSNNIDYCYYPAELDGGTLILKTQQTLDIGHRETKVELPWKPLPIG